MKKNKVGTSGLRVGQIGLGTLTWGRDTEYDDAARMVRSLIDHGGNLVDISPLYGEGQAIGVLGSMFDGDVDRTELVLSAHIGLSVHGGRVIQDSSRSGIIASVDQILGELGTDHLDIVSIAAPDHDVPFREMIETLAALVTSGKARYIGLANHPAWQIARVAQYLSDMRLTDLASVNADYSLLDRTVEDNVSAVCGAFGLGIIAQSPLAAGVLTGKYRNTIPATSRAATEHLSATVDRYLDSDSRRSVEAVIKAADGLGRTPADVSLAWLLARDHVASVLSGARTAAQFDQLLALDLSALPAPVDDVLSEVTV
ncbi:aldo/keto reductase [Arcanobacterium haemolyticum]|uniref:Aldo/keto reductase n=1 Tax=Arcanobacterium haemolyticum (strain ATCC 9345 / DSM 20595 / CCM 5947 / CCUG 17215 / LMG 16163 / NBRC 15585 / NCTC 8452 / 11018) TaxID=644284 RepID=D7BNY6_ARCHD|nr:aldo/keto reductase [Arcanobacterium haemolyticum]ADH92635.1 aldo/keto reductase [Arcanobacterium haemolyticum DSM 20595]SPT74386.1 L-glyceraldehyde 3-phosphate reductase [Arcanobacterium haemolyticum]SQH28630.1 L-glyceraldehyde 3-phosphate reductase [Arcanobacterium haemolyticum]